MLKVTHSNEPSSKHLVGLFKIPIWGFRVDNLKQIDDEVWANICHKFWTLHHFEFLRTLTDGLITNFHSEIMKHYWALKFQFNHCKILVPVNEKLHRMSTICFRTFLVLLPIIFLIHVHHKMFLGSRSRDKWVRILNLL